MTVLRTRAMTGKMEVKGQMGVFVKYMGGPQTLLDNYWILGHVWQKLLVVPSIYISFLPSRDSTDPTLTLNRICEHLTRVCISQAPL